MHLLEKTNARYLTPDVLGETADFIAMDVSFISATLVIPAVIASAFPSHARRSRGPPDRCAGEATVRSRQGIRG